MTRAAGSSRPAIVSAISAPASTSSRSGSRQPHRPATGHRSQHRPRDHAPPRPPSSPDAEAGPQDHIRVIISPAGGIPTSTRQTSDHAKCVRASLQLPLTSASDRRRSGSARMRRASVNISDRPHRAETPSADLHLSNRQTLLGNAPAARPAPPTQVSSRTVVPSASICAVMGGIIRYPLMRSRALSRSPPRTGSHGPRRPPGTARPVCAPPRATVGERRRRRP